MAEANCIPCREQPSETVRISWRDFRRLPDHAREREGGKLVVLTERNGRQVKLPVEIVKPKPTRCNEAGVLAIT